jgi:hypothetical protein
MELLIGLAIVALLFAPFVLVVFSRRAAGRRKLLWLGIMIAGYIAGEIAAGLYARGRVNPLHPDSPESFVAMLIELSATITLVWLAYAGFWFTTRRREST